MKKHLSLITLLLVFVSAISQNSGNNKFNFDFENTKDKMPVGWTNFGGPNYKISLDSAIFKTGKYSAVIEYNEGASDFKAWAFTLPENYPGKKIKLSGYIKTENVTDGYAGLWMRIDPQIAFDNMNDRGVRGTTDWKKFEVTLDMDPEKTKQIVIGALLVGKGKMWVDDLSVTIDGKDVKLVKPFERPLTQVENDKEFKDGSKIAIESLNAVQLQNLKTLGLVWGFVKYHHPQIANGKLNWDFELFRVLPSVLNASDSKSRDNELINWIQKIGEFELRSKTKSQKDSVKIKPDLEWITGSGLSPELSDLLTKIRNAKRGNENYYIALNPNVGNPDFKNEEAYASIKYPDAGFRLLALYRYWNLIQYYFPYKNLIEGDWKNVLEEFIPKVIAAKNETEYTLTMLELIGGIGDTHANVWGRNQALNNYFGERYAAIEGGFVEDKFIVTGYYNDQLGKLSGLQTGDIISKINGKAVNEIVKENLKYTPASNYPTQLRDLAAKLLRTNDTSIVIEFMADNKIQSTVLKTYTSNKVDLYKRYNTSDTCFRIINKDIAYISNGSVKGAYLKTLWKEIEPTKGLIIDNRNYPSDFVLYELSNYLMPESIQFVKFSNGNIQEPGLFTFTEPIRAGKKNSSYYKGKVIILVNEVSQSSSEFHAMAYRVHPNAKVIGSTTAGADGNVSQFYLPGGITTMISGIGVYYPNGKETQGIGIIPDIECKPTIKGIKEGRDEVLEKAIELIK